MLEAASEGDRAKPPGQVQLHEPGLTPCELPARRGAVPLRAAQGALWRGGCPRLGAAACLGARVRLARGGGGLQPGRGGMSAAAAGPVAQGLKEALVETLTGILCPVQAVRAAAEEQVKVLEVTEGECGAPARPFVRRAERHGRASPCSGRLQELWLDGDGAGPRPCGDETRPRGGGRAEGRSPRDETASVLPGNGDGAPPSAALLCRPGPAPRAGESRAHKGAGFLRCSHAFKPASACFSSPKGLWVRACPFVLTDTFSLCSFSLAALSRCPWETRTPTVLEEKCAFDARLGNISLNNNLRLVLLGIVRSDGLD